MPHSTSFLDDPSFLVEFFLFLSDHFPSFDDLMEFRLSIQKIKNLIFNVNLLI